MQYAREEQDLEHWTEDSGISSDDTVDHLQQLGQSSLEVSRSNSDDNLNKDEMRLKMKERAIDRLYNGNGGPNDNQGSSGSDRASPPLYEVELTASDEDDDGSVLELVIPMQTSRYHRVPTSSPKKRKPKIVQRYICSIMCCGRTRK